MKNEESENAQHYYQPDAVFLVIFENDEEKRYQVAQIECEKSYKKEYFARHKIEIHENCSEQQNERRKI